MTMNGFVSIRDAVSSLVQALAGPSLIRSLRHVDPRLREKILLSVSIANNCGN